MNIQIQSITQPQELRILANALELLAKEREQAANEPQYVVPVVVPEIADAEAQAQEVKPAPKKTKAAKPAPTADTQAETAQPAPSAPPTGTAESASEVTLEQVRAKLTTLSQNGKKSEAKALLDQFGVAKLTDLAEDKYAELLAAAEEL